MMFRSIYLTLAALGLTVTAQAAGGAQHELPDMDWQFEGLPTAWDKNQILRGATVATQACMACHSFKYISSRDLIKTGFTENEAKIFAEQMGLDLNDKWMSALSDEDAQGVYGKKVPDLSVMNRARKGGADYVYALLTGYEDPPEGSDINYYNPVFGGAIAMPNPLVEGQVQYHDGTEATVAQMAKDVTYFMQFTAEPELIERKQLGVYVLLYVLLMIILTYLYKNAVWRDVKKKK